MNTAYGGSTIVVVDNDSSMRYLLSSYLSKEGFEVLGVGEGASLSAILYHRAIALIVLGLQLPDESGTSICGQLRAAGVKTPIIILSANAQDEDRIAGLMVGADDYVCKPFNPTEVSARIRAILRRTLPREEPAAPSSRNEIFRFGPFEFNIGTRALLKNGRLLNITTSQFAIFKVLVRHAGRPISRERIALLACDRSYGSFQRGLDVHVSRIRKLLEDGSASYIQTVWSVGYMFEPSGRREVIHASHLCQ